MSNIALIIMDKDVIELLRELFTPAGALAALILVGLFTALYTAIIKYWFDKRLKSAENQHALEMAELQGRITGHNQVVLQDLQTRNSAALKHLESELTERTQQKLEALKSTLTEERSQKQSRLDYEYEARKRLYHECEPLVFELLEFAENAADRIRSLARSARQGNLPRWLADEGYYTASTMYYLLAPVAVYKLMRRRLTAVDMRLDDSIARHYQLAKRIAWSFADDFSFAWGLHVCELEYDPNNSDWVTLRTIDEPKYWRQGLPYGRLDNAVESLIVRDHEPDGELRIRSFGEFEAAFHQEGPLRENFAIVRDIIANFHPRLRPIFWRMLITQAHIHRSIVEFHYDQGGSQSLVVTPIPLEERDSFSWTRSPNSSDTQKMEASFIVAEAYLKKNLGELWAEPSLSARA